MAKDTHSLSREPTSQFYYDTFVNRSSDLEEDTCEEVEEDPPESSPESEPQDDPDSTFTKPAVWKVYEANDPRNRKKLPPRPAPTRDPADKVTTAESVIRVMARSGGFGGRGGLKGASWEMDPTLKLDSKPSELFPSSYQVPYAPPPSEEAKRQVKNFIELRDQIHRGPLYTKPRKRDPGEPKKIYGEDQDNEQYAARSKADFDPFTGVPTYSMKYDQKQRSIPQLSNLPFNKNLFPKELWSTLEGEEGEEARRTINKGVKKLLQLSRADSPDELSHLTPEERKKQMEDRMKNIEDDEAGGEEEMFGENDEEEEEDVDYENDEAEMGGDYDAEQYFDDGDKDDDGDDAGGDDY